MKKNLIEIKKETQTTIIMKTTKTTYTMAMANIKVVTHRM